MKDGDPYGYGDFRLNITEQPRDSIFVDEKKYNGIFPATISKENTPQIYEIKSDDGKKTELFNGIFGKNRQFKNGKVTLHGYGGLYDGVWYSEDWIANDVFVSFTPENTNDVVFGYFTEKFMQDFHLTIASHDKFQSRAIGNPHFEITGNNNCKWVKEIYDPYSIVRDKENAQKVEAKFAEQKRLHPEQWNANPNTVNVPIPTPKSNIPIQVEKVKSKCYSCDGHGWTEQINSYGLRLHEQCKVCGGKGYNYE